LTICVFPAHGLSLPMTGSLLSLFFPLLSDRLAGETSALSRFRELPQIASKVVTQSERYRFEDSGWDENQAFS
jgi:hypothetical protein